MKEIALALPAASRELRFRALLHGHRERVVSLAWRLTGGDRAVAEDVAQEALVRAWNGLPRFREEARLETWLYRIVVREAASWRRRQAVRGFLGGLRGSKEQAAPPVERDGGLKRRIAAALDKLSAGQREAFVLVHLEGFTVAEAAATLGKAEGTVKSHLHRALATLRVDLKDAWEDYR